MKKDYGTYAYRKQLKQPFNNREMVLIIPTLGPQFTIESKDEVELIVDVAEYCASFIFKGMSNDELVEHMKSGMLHIRPNGKIRKMEKSATGEEFRPVEAELLNDKEVA